MKRFNGKRTPPQKPAGPDGDAERRRLGRIVHDERGAASLEWRDAPDDYDRPVLEIGGTGVRPTSKGRLGEDSLSIKTEDSFNPYDRPQPADERALPGAPGKGGKRDLKKLSAWLKMMRELEERKKNGDEED